MTPTETAIRAVVAALQAKSEEDGSPLPAPLRNENLLTRLVETGDSLAKHLNVLDGDRAEPDALLGADLGNITAYDINWRVRVEWAVAGGTSDARETAFDDGRKAIWDALKPALSGGSPTYLGGAVSSITLIDMLPQDASNAQGLPNVKATEFLFELTYTSADPF